MGQVHGNAVSRDQNRPIKHVPRVNDFDIVDQLLIPLKEWHKHYPLKEVVRHPPVFLSHISHPHVVDSSRDSLLFKQD